MLLQKGSVHSEIIAGKDTAKPIQELSEDLAGLSPRQAPKPDIAAVTHMPAAPMWILKCGY